MKEWIDILVECFEDLLHDWYIWLPFIVFIIVLGIYLNG